MKIDLKTAQTLTSEEARDTLLLFRNHSDDPLAIQEAFRGMFPKKIAEALGELSALRRRATTKFSRGLDMFFTKEQLQQSSSEAVARHRAERFRRAGAEEVWDPCCGIGADAIALALAGIRVHASDREPSAVHFALANTSEYGVAERIDVRELDCAAAPAEVGPGLLFLDPSRRRGSRRIMSPAEWSPDPASVAHLLEGRPGAGVKLSPAVDLDVLLATYPEPGEIEVISLRGEAKETIFWYGCLAGAEPRRATALPSGESYAGPPRPQADSGDFGAYFYDPDPALVHAGLLGAFAAEHGLRTVDPEIAYLTGDTAVLSPFLDSFRVLAIETLDPRRMRKLLRDLEVGSLEVRKRGIAERQLALEQRLLPQSFGARRATLLAARVGDRHLGIVAEPLEDV